MQPRAASPLPVTWDTQFECSGSGYGGCWSSSSAPKSTSTDQKLQLFPVSKMMLFYHRRKKVELPVTTYGQKYSINDPTVCLGTEVDDA